MDHFHSFPPIGPIGVKMSKEIWYLKPPPNDQMNGLESFSFFEGFAKASALVCAASKDVFEG